MSAQDERDDGLVAAQELKASGRSGPVRRIHRAVKEIEPWGILLAALALWVLVVSFWSDYSARVEERMVRAWQHLTIQGPGNIGKVAALQYLNSEDGLLCTDLLRGHLAWLHNNDNISCLISLKAPTPLDGIDLSPPNPEDNGTPEDPADDPPGEYLVNVDLYGASLHGANLLEANLAGANLTGADLSGANLWGAALDHAALSGADLTAATLSEATLFGADLHGANLADASLAGANLHGADLREATLGGADLFDADLFRATLSGADLASVTGLTQAHLDSACGDEDTKLPAGLIIPRCM
jgi:hypothetical protein